MYIGYKVRTDIFSINSETNFTTLFFEKIFIFQKKLIYFLLENGNPIKIKLAVKVDRGSSNEGLVLFLFVTSTCQS